MCRLDKYLCDSGAGTRSQVKALLKAGRVTVDGVPEKDPGRKIAPERQSIALDGERLGGKRRLTVMLNKPAGYVTATEDPDQPTVMELLPPELRHLDLKPVGRLDKATEGLLLFTNDGDLLHRLISPKREVPKVYYARHEGRATAEDAEAFARGLELRDGTVCLPAKLEPLAEGGKPDHGLRRKISPGPPDDGLPGDDGMLPGTQAGGRSYPGGTAKRRRPGADGAGASDAGAAVRGRYGQYAGRYLNKSGGSQNAIGILPKKLKSFCSKMSKGTCKLRKTCV